MQRAYSPTDFLKGYVALLALLHLNDQTVTDELRLWSPTRLSWVPSLLAEWDSMRRPTTVNRIDLPALVQTARAVPVVVGTSSNDLSQSLIGVAND
jgi:hypothetical protein